jgi:hypothetical protein
MGFLRQVAALGPRVWFYAIRAVWLLAGGCTIVAASMAAYYLPRIGSSAPAPAPAPAAAAPPAAEVAAAPAGTAATWVPTQVEFVTIILTAIAVMLAGLAIVLALASVVGYVQIKNAAETAAKQAAEKVASARAEGVAKDFLEERVPRMVEGLMQQVAPGGNSGDEFMRAAKGGSGDDDN